MARARAKSPVAALVTELRKKLGETQKLFADRLGVSITTVAKYETTNPPTGKALFDFVRLAESIGANDEAHDLRNAYLAELWEREQFAPLELSPVQQSLLPMEFGELGEELDRLDRLLTDIAARLAQPDLKIADILEGVRASVDSVRRARPRYTYTQSVLSTICPGIRDPESPVKVAGAHERQSS